MGPLPWPLADQVFREVARAGALVIVVALVARLGLLFIDRLVGWITGRTKNELDEMIANAVRMPLFFIAILLGARAGLAELTFLEPAWERAFEGVLFGALVLTGYLLLHRVIGDVASWYLRGLMADGAVDRQLILFMRRMTQVVLLSIALIMILDHFGFDISALVATLGVGSLAFALAARSFLEDAIAGFLIMIDKPFGVGDRLQLPQTVMGEYGDWGDVAQIGVRSTRIRSVDGVLLTVPNSKLINEVVVNFSHSESPNLRVRVRIGVEPELRNVQRSVEEIERIALEDPDISREPRAPEVVVREIQEYDVLVELRFYVDDARKMRRTKSRVTQNIMAAFEEEGIRIATPKQVVQLVDGGKGETL